MHKALEYIASLAEKDGFNVDRCDGYCTEISYGEGPLIAIYAHCDVDSEQKDRQGQQLKILLDKIAAIPAEKLERNATVVEDINIKLNGLKSYFQIRKESVEVDMDTLTREIENFTEYISYIKNTL